MRPAALVALPVLFALLAASRDARAQYADRDGPAAVVSGAGVDFALGAGVMLRHFEYRNGIAPRPYTSDGAAIVVDGAAQFYPMWRAPAPWRDVGIIAEGTIAPSNGQAPAGTVAYAGGLRFRLHPSARDRVVLGVSAAYSFTSFVAAGTPQAEVPAVDYRVLRPALDGRVALGAASLLFGTALRAPIDRGAMSSEFYGPRGFGYGFDFGVALMPVRDVEARLLASYERDEFVFHPPPGLFLGAGGASDSRLTCTLSFAFVR